MLDVLCRTTLGGYMNRCAGRLKYLDIDKQFLRLVASLAVFR